MSFTRFHDDPCRIKKQLQEITGTERYMLNVPGNGDKPCFMEDPFIRMEKWGSNLMTNPVDIDSDLKGLTRTLSRDCEKSNNFENHTVNTQEVSYPSCQPITDQSRATDPAWTFRDIEQVNLTNSPIEFNNNVGIQFQNNICSRLTEKELYNSKCSKN